ncbi:MAG: hypothetical protein JST08_16415 [Actinobacteria bacterium]|nr:hypothetical protein [Actinomycetota bacterium]
MRIVRGRRSHRLGLVTTLLGLALCLAFAASAAAEVRRGSVTNPVDESLPVGQDIVAVSASYDTVTGTATAAVTTRGAPEPGAARLLRTDFYAVNAAGECTEPELRVGATYSQSAAGWRYGAGEGSGTKSVVGSTTTLTVTAPSLVGQPLSCMNAYIVREVGGELEPFEYLVPPLKLVAPLEPPAPTPTVPSSPPPATPPAPAPKSPPKVKPKPSLTVASPSLTLHRNSWTKVKVTIANGGNAAAAKVSLKVGKAKGVTIKPRSGTLKLKSIGAGKSKTASFKVLLTKRAKASSKLKLTVAGAKGVKASGGLTVTAWKKPSPPKKGGKGKKEGKQPTPPAPPPLAEKIFYRLEMQASESAKLAAFTFIDGTWAYNGMPSGGLPNCTAVTGGPDTEGCIKYTYDPSSGAVGLESIGTGKITAGGSLEVGEKAYSPTAIPAAGTRLQVEQEYVGFSGFCGPFSTCTTWHEYVTLTNSGEFILSRQSLTTSEGAGSFVAAGSYPPDQHGTYAIEGSARIKLNFADGTSQTKTIAIVLNKEGKPDPVNEGLLLDSSYFTFAHTG